MTQDEARRSVVQYWMRKADDALASARSEFSAGRMDFAVNRAYYRRSKPLPYGDRDRIDSV